MARAYCWNMEMRGIDPRVEDCGVGKVRKMRSGTIRREDDGTCYTCPYCFLDEEIEGLVYLYEVRERLPEIARATNKERKALIEFMLANMEAQKLKSKKARERLERARRIIEREVLEKEGEE